MTGTVELRWHRAGASAVLFPGGPPVARVQMMLTPELKHGISIEQKLRINSRVTITIIVCLN